jgi:hypothetical protein
MDVKERSAVQKTEHPLITRLVVLRVALNHEFGGAFTPYDHELAEIEGELVKMFPRHGGEPPAEPTPQFWREIASMTKEDVARLLHHTQQERDAAVDRLAARADTAARQTSG